MEHRGIINKESIWAFATCQSIVSVLKLIESFSGRMFEERKMAIEVMVKMFGQL